MNWWLIAGLGCFIFVVFLWGALALASRDDDEAERRAADWPWPPHDAPSEMPPPSGLAAFARTEPELQPNMTQLMMASGAKITVAMAYEEMCELVKVHRGHRATCELLEAVREDGSAVLVNLANVDYVQRVVIPPHPALT